MSQENVQKVRAFWEQWDEDGWAWNTWRRGDVDMSVIHPQVVYEDHNLPDHVGEAYLGHEGVVRAAERWTEPFESLAVEVERIVDFGDHLVSFHRWRAKFRHTGIEINEPLAYRWRFEEGKVIYFCSLSPQEADEAAGPVGQAMSGENVEIVKRGIAAYNAGDMDAMMRTYATNLEAFPDASAFPDAHPCHGREEFRAWLEESATAWTKPSWVVTEVLTVDSGRVLVRGNWGGEGVASGLATTASITGIFAVGDGQVSRVEFFVDHQQALKAVGPEE